MHESHDSRVAIRTFRPGDADAFRTLNEAWIERYFELEDKDRKTFDDVQAGILDRGGEILFATLESEIVGCCALIAMRDNEYEIAKMAVSELQQNKGVGRKLLSAAIALAKERGAARLYLETNRLLQPAIALYRSFGFRELDPAMIRCSPYARADVFMELHPLS